MTYVEYQQYMRNFFEQYYQKLSRDDAPMLPLGDNEKEMWSDDADPESEWKKWKLVPTAIEDGEIEALEKDIAVTLPLSLRAFLTVYHHYFESPIGRNPFSKHFEAIRNAWNPLLVKFGYLPFTWDEEGYFIRCIRLAEMPKEEKCGIYQIDHEILFDFDEETVTQEEIDENMKFLSQNLLTYLDEILHDKDVDSMWKAAQKAIVTTIREKFGITDFDALVEKNDEDPGCIFEALRPIQEQYSLTDSEVEDFLDMLEYESSWMC